MYRGGLLVRCHCPHWTHLYGRSTAPALPASLLFLPAALTTLADTLAADLLQYITLPLEHPIDGLPHLKALPDIQPPWYSLQLG
jgi:hypothetical protein